MNESDQDYILKVQKSFISRYLDEKISVTDASLQILEANREQIVWDIASQIYTQIGHKIDLIVVRNEVNNRINTLRHQLAAKKEERQAREVVEAEKRAREAAEAEKRAREVAEVQERWDREKENLIAGTSSSFDGNEAKARVFLRVCEITAEQLSVDIEQVTLDANFQNDLNADSLDNVELVMALEEAFDIEIPDEAAEEIRTVGDAVAYVYVKVNSSLT